MDIVDPIRVLLSFVLVVALIGLSALAMRFVLRRNPGWALHKGGGRLQIIESKMIDARRRLVLIKRDEQEHLLLLSPQSELLIERVEKKNV
ncbi:MAG: flagellar biosynthetic protein FliO [Alphaproteobacteria bacterium]|nr:flagellar biosynthetic protein FliO [Alphaproteobacteria bacterium]